MDMIKKLHRQFILLATLAVFIIIAVALSVINGMMYLIVRGDIHDVLETIADNGGVITTRRISGGGWLPDGSWVEDTPEFTYQTRYFSVLLDSDGTAKVTNINHIAAFSAESAVEAAVAAVKERHYDVVFMDGNMPEMDGLEATRKIRAEVAPERQPRIVALTASAQTSDSTRCFEVGMDDYLK